MNNHAKHMNQVGTISMIHKYEIFII